MQFRLLLLLLTTTALPAWAHEEPGQVAPAQPQQPVVAAESPEAAQTPAVGPTIPVKPGDDILFEADRLDYDSETDVVTAVGNVILVRDKHRLRADQVSYNRRTGFVEARGNVHLVDPDGNIVTGDKIELTETLRQGLVENILFILTDGSRLAARSGNRSGDVASLNRAVYSPCDLCASGESTERPLWRIKAVRVIYDQKRKRLTYRHATFDFLNVPIFYSPYMSHADPDVTRASGFLIPDPSQSRALGLSLATPYFWDIAPNRDLLVTPTFYTETRPTLGLEYREHLGSGPIRLGTTVTYARRPLDETGTRTGQDIRGYFYGEGQLQHSARWRSSFDTMISTDDTFLRRYDISDDDVLRNSYRLEYFGNRDYLTVQAWAFQGLRVTDRFGEMPIALPSIDYRWNSPIDARLGQLSVRANSLSLLRTDAMDTVRTSATGTWQNTWLNSWGHSFRLVGMVRGDAYYVHEADDPDQAAYAGENGWQGRFLPLAAAEISWPLAGPSFGGFQTLTPIAQLVAAGPGHNDVIPNEDSRAFDLEDTNLFDLNRFAGLDRWESGTRVTYGLRWAWTGRGVTITADAGQSYRLSSGDNDLFPNGTGLAGDFSDIVGRASVRWGRYIDFVYRYRLDKNNLSARRSEVDAYLGTEQNYLTIGYTNLNRNIFLEDLEDREEIRLGGRVQLSRYWSLNGATIVDLTSQGENPTSKGDGFQPIRQSVGVEYEDECFTFSVTWRRRFTEDRDFERGSTIYLRFGLKNLAGGR